MPLRVRNVPRIESRNVEKISHMFQTFNMPRFSCIITECRRAVPVSHGISEAFSTGSHPQYPPQPRTEYAQCWPRKMPQVRNSHVTIVQRRVMWIHFSPGYFMISAPSAKANGTEKPTYPRYSIGGWMTISGYCSSGFKPLPSSGGLPGSMANGCAAKFSSKRKKSWTPAMIVPAYANSRRSTRCRNRKTKPYVESSHAQKSSEPSCPDHRVANLYGPGSAMLLWCAM